MGNRTNPLTTYRDKDKGRGEGRQRGKMRGGRGEMDGGGWCGQGGESDGCGRVVVVVVVGMMST